MVVEKDTFVHSQATKQHLLNQYKISNMLGKGAFGEVYKATHLIDGSQIAIKTIKKSGMSRFEIVELCNELAILQKLDHPNISKYFENYEDANFIYICMELLEGGDLVNKDFEEV
jgi:calcium-dependent protein kinase